AGVARPRGRGSAGPPRRRLSASCPPLPRCRGGRSVSHPHAVWITGVGTATSLGHAFQPFADRLLPGCSGRDRVIGCAVTDPPSQSAAQFGAVPCPPSIDPAEFATLPRLEQVVLWCCETALRDAGWWDRRHEARVGLALGMGAELL